MSARLKGEIHGFLLGGGRVTPRDAAVRAGGITR